MASREPRRRRTLWTLVWPCLLACCAHEPAAPTAARAVDADTWRAIVESLATQRRDLPVRPWGAVVRMTLREPRTGRIIDGRGAIAVSPGRAVRMILVGAVGATMLDAWATPDRWRIAVPPVDLVRRGAADEPADLPVAFLRWLFFRRLEGTLFGGSLHAGVVNLLLRDGDAVLDVRYATGACAQGALTTTTRRAHARTERLDECRAEGVPRAGDWVRYADEASGLRVDLAIESALPGPASDDAFRDPDAPAPADPGGSEVGS